VDTRESDRDAPEEGLPQDVVLEVPLLREARRTPPPAPNPEPGPPSDETPEPGFRIVVHKPMRPTPRRRTSQVRNVTVLAAVPACFLILYVFFVTAAVKGGYYKSSLQTQLENLRVEQADLDAELRRLQAPGVIFSRAERLGMRTAEERQYVRAPREARPPQPEGAARL